MKGLKYIAAFGVFAAMVACAGHIHLGMYGRGVIDFLFGISNLIWFEFWRED